MFELTINGKVTEVKCGIRFLKELNKRYTYEVEGISLAFGIQSIGMLMELRSPDVLIDLIECGTRHIRNGFKPTTEEIEAFLDEQEEYDSLFDLFDEELRTSMATKKSYLEVAGPKAKAKSTTKKNTKK